MRKLLSALFFSAISASASASVIVTNPFDPYHEMHSLGENYSTTFGMVFTTPDDRNTRLDSFSFIVKSEFGIDYYNSELGVNKFYGAVAEWTEPRLGPLSGPELFTSNIFSGSYQDWTEITVNTSGLLLTPAKNYIAYFSAAGLVDGVNDSLIFNMSSGNSLLGFAWQNTNGAPPSSTAWYGCGYSYCGDWQLSGSMQFSEASADVPEPSSLALIGLAMVGLAVTCRRKA